MNLNLETEEYPDLEQTNSEHNMLEYQESEEWIEEENPLDEPNLLSNSEIIFGKRWSHLLWTSFTLETEPEPENDLERSFQALSLNSKPSKTEQTNLGETMAQPGSRNHLI